MVHRFYVPYMEDDCSDWSPNCVIKYEDYQELEAAAAELLKYAKDNKPHGEESQWLGAHPIDVMEKLLK